MFANGITHYDVVGFMGVALYIGTYAMLQLALLRSEGYLYSILQLTAASLVLYSLGHAFNLSSTIIQLTYIALSLVGIARLSWLRFHRRLEPEEAELALKILPGLQPMEAFPIMRAGKFKTVKSGTTLTTEGLPVKELVYMIEGSAKVYSQGKKIARVKSGNFIGEITYHTGSAATGTVIVSKKSRLFAINSEKLRELLKGKPQLFASIERGIAQNMRTKLTAHNARIVAKPVKV